MSRVLLVTGGAGFIGANFVRYWVENHHQDRILVLDKLTYAANVRSIEDLQTNALIQLVVGDICDYERVRGLMRTENVDTIVHFAAESHVDRSITGPDEFIRTNIVGTHSLLKAAKDVWVDGGIGRPHRFHHVSTDEVFGSLAIEDPSFHEACAYRPNSPYAASKAASDHLVRAYAQTFGLQTTISNCSNNYGPYQFPEKLIPLCIVSALRGEYLPIYGRGKNIRDWLHVLDHCRAIDMILNHGIAGSTYNIGGGFEIDNLTLVEMLCRIIDMRLEVSQELRDRFPKSPVTHGKSVCTLIRFVPDRPGHDFRYSIDSSRLTRELGFRPIETIERGLQATLDWYLENETWWQGIETRTRS